MQNIDNYLRASHTHAQGQLSTDAASYALKIPMKEHMCMAFDVMAMIINHYGLMAYEYSFLLKTCRFDLCPPYQSESDPACASMPCLRSHAPARFPYGSPPPAGVRVRARIPRLALAGSGSGSGTGMWAQPASRRGGLLVPGHVGQAEYTFPCSGPSRNLCSEARPT